MYTTWMQGNIIQTSTILHVMGLKRNWCMGHHTSEGLLSSLPHVIMDTKKYWICKGVTTLLKFCTIPKIQPWDCITQIAETLLVETKQRKGKRIIQTSPGIWKTDQNLRRYNRFSNYDSDHSHCTHCTHWITLTQTQQCCENDTSNPSALHLQQ